jgi:FkbM family methyltransferase
MPTYATLRTPFDESVFSICGNPNDRSVFSAVSSQEVWEPHIMLALKRCIRARDTCLDIGANIGAITLALSKLAFEGRVFAFEPSQQNYDFLAANLACNEITNVSLQRCAFWDRDGELTFSFIDELAGCSFVNDGVSGTSGLEKIRSVVTAEWAQREPLQVSTETVECVKLDTWVEQSKIENIEFIKLDVEGAETAVLEGASTTIARFRPLLLTEYNPACAIQYFARSESEYFNVLQRLFQFIYLIEEDARLTAIQGYDSLSERLRLGKGWEDLICTFESL